MNFKPGSAVEVSTDGGHSWHSGTIVKCVGSDGFLVQSNNNFLWRKVVNLHQLRRPLPHRKLNSGTKVKEFGIGFPIRSFPNSKQMEFAHHNLINRFGVTSEDNDMLSELPDIVLLHIMNFMDTKDAIRTCVLSKRWKDLCKRVPNLTFRRRPRPRAYMKNRIETETETEAFMKFASWVLSNRDDSYSVTLTNLIVDHCAEPGLLDKVIEYALVRDVQNLTVGLGSGVAPLKSLALIFHCQTLTSLKLYSFLVILPKSLLLPALKSLHLEKVEFTATRDQADPFSNCTVLDTLVLGDFSLHNDAKVLCISNSTLSRLTIFGVRAYKIELSTPNLGSCTISDCVGHELTSKCNLSLLRDVIIGTSLNTSSTNVDGSNVMGWLQVLANVKILTLHGSTFLRMFRVLSNSLPTKPKLQPPRFARLESLKVAKHTFVTNEKINRLVECLLQNSPMAKIDITVLK